MKKVLLVSASVFFSSFLFAQNSTAKVETASVVTAVAEPIGEGFKVDKLEHDFGKIPQGKPVTTQFVITNNSKHPFKLDNVQASCGCTTPTWDREKVLKPGDSTLVTVGYNAAAEGPFTKPVTITFNTNEVKQLMIKGTVWNTPAASAPVNEKVIELENK